MDIIEQVSDYCCSIKPNTQYYLGHTDILEKIAKKSHDHGMLAILDHKLSDIGSTNSSALYWIKEMGFDAFTFSPFAGNTQKTVEKAHENNLGVIVLTLMSNPEPKIEKLIPIFDENEEPSSVAEQLDRIPTEILEELKKNGDNKK
ncbi:Orotidine 5'-phosphate decarboxylase [subsurface metagenome]